MNKKRGLSSEDARRVRQKGHDDALDFAIAIGLEHDYQNDAKAKKDVIDPSGDAHSVKSGKKKWQVFLYGLGRFENDETFQVMNGIGNLLADCINSFPNTYNEYMNNKQVAKQRLRIPMRELAVKFQNKTRVKAFLNKSIFNNGEVDYLTVKHDDKFHIFLAEDVLDCMSKHFEVCNSKAYNSKQTDEQKVLFKYGSRNIGELEMRNDSSVHYREVRFNMIKTRVMDFLFEQITPVKAFNEKVYVYGRALRKFGKWLYM